MDSGDPELYIDTTNARNLMMDLSAYSAKMLVFVQELQESLSTSDRLGLIVECRLMGLDSYKEWVAQHMKEIARFAESTPKQRQDRQHPDRERRMLTLAAAQHIAWSRHLLEAILPLEREQGYREMVNTAWHARVTLARGKSVYAWPFPLIEDPFSRG